MENEMFPLSPTSVWLATVFLVFVEGHSVRAPLPLGVQQSIFGIVVEPAVAKGI